MCNADYKPISIQFKLHMVVHTIHNESNKPKQSRQSVTPKHRQDYHSYTMVYSFRDFFGINIYLKSLPVLITVVNSYVVHSFVYAIPIIYHASLVSHDLSHLGYRLSSNGSMSHCN